MSDVTRILDDLRQGAPGAYDRLLEAVYAELRRMAAQRMARERDGHTLAPTELVHEAYLRLIPSAGGSEGHAGGNPAPHPEWKCRTHFFAAAAEAMRRILVEQARRRSRQKRGGGQSVIALDDAAMSRLRASEDVADTGTDTQILAVHAALEALAFEDPQKAELVKLRYFAGLTLEQAADVLGISRATASRYWTYARAWLLDSMQDIDPRNDNVC